MTIGDEMLRRMDKDIFWVVLIALTFWAGVWKHEWVTDLLHRAILALSTHRLLW